MTRDIEHMYSKEAMNMAYTHTQHNTKLSRKQKQTTYSTNSNIDNIEFNEIYYHAQELKKRRGTKKRIVKFLHWIDVVARAVFCRHIYLHSDLSTTKSEISTELNEKYNHQRISHVNKTSSLNMD